jgi:hypothetical protein
MRLHRVLIIPQLLAVLITCEAEVSSALAQEGLQSRKSIVGTDSLKERQADFLNRIRNSDPQHQTIKRAIINQENELGLILDRNVEMDKVPALLRTILVQMAREFPRRDLTVLAYTPSNPPHKIGTARLRAQTGEMTYTPAQ